MPASRHITWIVLAALFAITLACRWKIIADFGQPVPFHDQWTAEGVAILEPWIAGEFGWDDLWKPSNEHRPVLTRVLALAGVQLSGQWDTRTQMLVNCLFYSLTAVALSLVARAVFAARGWIAATAAIVVFFALPANYENAVWGFQSQFYLMVLLGVLYLGGTFCSARIDRRWIAAQSAGAIGLLSMGGGMLAPVVAAAIAAARLVRRRDAHGFATLASAVVLALVGVCMLPASATGGPLQARSAILFIEALVKLLAWPSHVPLIAVLMQLPWLLVAVRAIAAREVRPGDLVLAALGGWVLLQSLAIAFARGGSFSEIPPRYFDILVIGLTANAVCLATLARDARRGVVPIVFGAAWIAVVATGLWHFNRPVRLDPILEGHSALQRRTLEVVRDYIRTGDAAELSRDPSVAHHFPSVATIKRLLDNPRLRASLPSELRGGEIRPFAERLTIGALHSWSWLLPIASVVFVLAGGAAVIRSRETVVPPEFSAPVPWFATAALLALAALALVAAGMRPWDTDPHRRLARMLDKCGEPAAGFDIAGTSGGIFALPETPAALFFGTYLGGDAFTGELVSTEFQVDRSRVVVPVTGYPNRAGNSLKLEVFDAEGVSLDAIAFSMEDPGERIVPWSITVSSNVGQRARLILVDGSSEPRGWLGVGTPRLTDSDFAPHRLRLALDSAGAENARRFPASLFAAAVVLAIAGVITGRRNLASAVMR